MTEHDVITMTRAELRGMLSEAAEQGARRALERIGLGDETAGDDVRDLRGLLSLWRGGVRTFWDTVFKGAALLVMGAVAGIAGVKVMGG